MRKYYAKQNLYGTATSVGFYNTWSVVVFSSKKARDEWIMENWDYDMSVDVCRRADIPRLLDDRAPKAFSGKRWVIQNNFPFDDDPDGYIGYVTSSYCDQPGETPLNP